MFRLGPHPLQGTSMGTWLEKPVKVESFEEWVRELGDAFQISRQSGSRHCTERLQGDRGTSFKDRAGNNREGVQGGKICPLR